MSPQDIIKALRNTFTISDGVKKRVSNIMDKKSDPLTYTGPSTKTDRKNMLDAGMNIAGNAPVGMMIGKGAKVWDTIAAEEAARLLRKGIDPHMTTGVHQGVDDILRQEIPDNAAKFHPGALDTLNASDDMQLQMVLDHPELFKAYPELKEMSVASGRGMDSMYNPEWDSIQLGRDSIDPMSSMLHEVQHKIQQTEGWAKGGAPSSFKQTPGSPTPSEQYKRLAGEVEARNTQKRQPLTAMERRRDHPYTTMDREIADQAVWGVGEELPGVVQKNIIDSLRKK